MTVTELTVAGRPAERHAPPSITGPGTVLYLHGGGYVSGSLATHRSFAGNLALAFGRRWWPSTTASAPSTPSRPPCTTRWRPCASCRPRVPWRWRATPAGGGLTVAALLALRDDGGPLPVAAVCVSPWVDLSQSGASYATRGDVDIMVSGASLTDMADHYLQGHDPADPLASPLFGDLRGLPPLRIDVGDAEVLLDDSVVLAERVRAAGGQAELVVWPELFHVFPAFPPEIIPEAAECVAAEGAFLAAHLAAPTE